MSAISAPVTRHSYFSGRQLRRPRPTLQAVSKTALSFSPARATNYAPLVCLSTSLATRWSYVGVIPMIPIAFGG